MAKIDDPKITKPIMREPEPAGTPIERKDPAGRDKDEASTAPKTSEAPKPADKPLPDPFAKRRTDAERASEPVDRPDERDITQLPKSR